MCWLLFHKPFSGKKHLRKNGEQVLNLHEMVIKHISVCSSNGNLNQVGGLKTQYTLFFPYGKVK